MKRPSKSPIPSPLPFVRRATASLVWAERVVFFSIGILLFLAAVALLKTSVGVLFYMFVGGVDTPIAYASEFLDAVLLVLMIVELAYTVILSLRGSVLQAEPFLIVGLIAVIRRILVITVGEPGQHGGNVSQNVLELAILTGVVIVFVGAIVLLRMRPLRDDPFTDDDRER
jgi:uncharacterized membrane protein (DUF373 family)